jgi:hypothetical protein
VESNKYRSGLSAGGPAHSFACIESASANTIIAAIRPRIMAFLASYSPLAAARSLARTFAARDICSFLFMSAGTAIYAGPALFVSI